MRIVFMGTPEFAVPSLRMLLEKGYNVAAVVTQPDRPKGRKRELTPPPVKAFALEHGLPVLQPEKMRAAEAVAAMAEYAPDLIVTAAYGQILPRGVLDLPRLGCVNVHGSLLPRYRGGAPIQRSVIDGEPSTGVTLMYMAEGLDTGDMIARVEVPITDEDTSGTMFEKLSVAGAKLLEEWLPRLEAGTAPRVKQDDALATYAPNLTRDDERLHWEHTSRQVFNRVRGLNPMAGAFTHLNGEVFKVWGCKAPAASDAELPTEWLASQPGTVLDSGPFGIRVRTGDGSIVLTEVQPAGKKMLSAAEYARGARLAPGTVLG
ncbi:methionyl-tRNA formyltransferase [Cohnella lubricantis]|uniref:Methionyl-tRNA formyltransferase n=1 Tax=Cohnella lubricantis TaxID=2163172 RepID=A0A841TCX8_9BACL|nr:methionyl-tRNA formyltransferase [Cohnella lubricantis]MBB6677208.1 methionyl-tRNA formyltransferase [Cohnella lubricantis]MBP2116982.1 methionyl-tRNA formyltransferase [Cohnella lubricantis]